MKPLWNAPSLGTLRAGPQRAITFLIVAVAAIASGLLIPFVLIAPLLPSVRSAWSKKPRRAWRAAVLASVGISASLLFPLSPMFVGVGVPFALPQAVAPPIELTLEAMLDAMDARQQAAAKADLIQWVNFSLIAELGLLPLVVATTIHSAMTRGTQSRPPASERSTA